MEIIEDEILLPNLDGSSSPIQMPKLKRLKKSSSSVTTDVARVLDDTISPNQDPDLDLNGVDSFNDNLDPPFSEPIVDSILKDSVSPISELKDFDDGLDPLFSVPEVGEGFDFEILDMERKEEEGFEKIGGIGGGIEKEKKVRKKLDLGEGSEEVAEKRKTKKRKGEKYDEKEKDNSRGRRKTEKERKAELEQIHVESQRLLRETRDASFKPVPLVQKPISSVLERIRLRKLEVLKKTSIICQSGSGSDFSMDEIPQDSSSTGDQNGARKNDGDAVAQPASQMDLNDAPPNPNSNVKEADKNSESNVRDSDQLNDPDDSRNPCLPTTDVDNSPDYLSSSEEDNDKENTDPSPPRLVRAVDMDSSPNAALAKAFLDDEAEEEDDSEQDLARFQENEEDDESDADEVLNDLIATGYKEAPIDHEKRNLLHQKWLEQQDAAGTDDILQRLKYGKKQREPTYLIGEEEDGDDIDNDDGDDDESGEECEDERSHDLPPTDVLRQNSKKAKQMIAQMFDDANDVYVHSDEEESEQTLLRQRILKQKDEPSIISPAVDENSREIFGLIKKLNIAPVIKKRGKNITPSFDSLVTGGNSNSSSRSSFLNRAASTSLPSSHKQASTTVRAFIFGRDDSNSRSGISTSESISDMDLKQNQPSKPATSNKFSKSSQAKPTASKMKIEATTSSTSTSLFQILRHSSMQFDEQLNKKSSTHHKITDTQVAHQFSAFKVEKRVRKIQSRF